jgi:alpha-glucosidase
MSSAQQATTPGALRSYSRTERGLLVNCSGPHLHISVLGTTIVRVRLIQGEQPAPRRSWAVTPADEDFSPIPFQVHETEQALLLETEALLMQIERNTCRVSFVEPGPDGRAFCADAAGDDGGMVLGTSQTSGALFIKHEQYDPAQRVACTKRIEEDEFFVGFGERTGPLERRGRQMVNWTTDPASEHGHGPNTDPLYIAVPVLMALRPGLTYGVFFNNTWHSRFAIGHEQPDTWLMEAKGGELDYYLVYGPTPAEVIDRMGMLLGRPPLPPRWALGYHQSRWGYHTADAVRNVAEQFRQRNIPCDTIHLDIDYMRGYRVFTWDDERFPDPVGLIADLREQGYRIVTIIDPGVKSDPDYEVYRDGLERDMFVHRADGDVFRGYAWPGAVVFPDFARPEVRQWWGDLHKILVEQGVSGIWNDMNEPAVFDRDFSQGIGEVGTIDLDALQGPANERTTHAEVHNLYGQGMARATYEGLCRHMGDRRPFVLTRSGFAGIQRWSFCWMGDNSSWWEHIEMQMPQLLNMGLSGVPFVGTDIGGFFGNCSAQLLARWMQIGTLSPFCRNHACTGTTPQEPWAFGPAIEVIYRDYVQLRYRLLPYLYTLAWEATQSNAPMLRPLLYHFPDDPATYTMHDQMMLGPFVLAAPIYQPGRTHRIVYLPEGTWFDWWTDERIEGPTHLIAHAPLERMPLYLRAGTILPTGPVMNYTDERPLDVLTLDLYPGNGAFDLYEDDGHSFAYQQDTYCTTLYTLHLEAGALTFTMHERGGAYVPPQRQLVLRLHAVNQITSEQYPDADYDADQRILTLRLNDDGSLNRLLFPLS